MTSQTFLKLTTLLSAFIFLSGVVAMEPQKRSMNAIYAEIRDNQARYSNTYKYDAIDLMRSRKANNFANTVSILEQMADNIPNYNQEDVRNLLSLIQSYEEELYTNELIGLNLFGTLAKHKDILCQIQARCSAKLNAPNEAAAQDICRQFDQLTGPQQMALSQLVFQMGVNLEEFTHFLGAINSDPAYRDSSLLPGETETDAQHWKNVQSMLIQSDWARRYNTRAVAVIAMFDPNYDNNPWEAERKVRAQVHPLYAHRHGKRRAASVKTASVTRKKSPAHRTHQS